MSGTIVVGGSRVSNITTKVYDASTGKLRWTADHGATVYAVFIDDFGNVYTGGSTTSSITTRKYNNQGTLQWSVDHGDRVRGIAIDSNGNIYTTGERTFSSNTTKKYNSSGTEITSGWPKDHGADTYGICVDGSDNVYVCGAVSSSVTHRKYNSSGTVQWSKNHGASLFTIALAPNSNYVTAGVSTGGYSLRVASLSSGDNVYSYSKLTTYAVSRGRDNSGSFNDTIISAGIVSSSISTYVFPYDAGTDSWTANHETTVRGIAVNRNNGEVYTTGLLSTSNITARKYNYAGTESTDDDWPLNHGGDTYAIAWSPWEPTIIPGLSIPLGLGTPICTFSASPPGLATQLLLATPSSTPRPDPFFNPDYPQVYRAYLTGGASLLELPMSGLQCRRRLGESTWLDVEIPTYSTALAAEIAGVATRELVIYAGYLIGGVETLGEMMRATLTEIRDEREGGRGSMRLTARVIPTTATVTSHQLTGVRQRGRDEQGRRIVACAVNPLVRPNHTVNDGLYTFTAGSITYRIDPTDAVMWIVESS